MQGDEIRALRRLQREQGLSSHVFMSERDGADEAQGLPWAIRSDRVAGQDAIPDTSAHAAAWLRLCPSQRRPRHQGAAGLARAQKHSAYGALYITPSWHRTGSKTFGAIRRLFPLMVHDASFGR
jgi:hypothetical protein